MAGEGDRRELAFEARRAALAATTLRLAGAKDEARSILREIEPRLMISTLFGLWVGALSRLAHERAVEPEQLLQEFAARSCLRENGMSNG